MKLLVGLVTFSFIVLRGYLYFSQQQTYAAFLDLALLPFYLIISIVERRWIYVALIAYLPASSVLFLPTGLVPFDLSLVLILMAVVLSIHTYKMRSAPATFGYTLVFYGFLAVYLLASIAYAAHGDFQELKSQLKIIHILLTTMLAAYGFSIIYDYRDHADVAFALEIGVVSYLFAAALGYLFPLTTYTWQLETDFFFKSLFRYPGMSSSNYVSHVLLVMIAIHKFMNERGEKPTSMVYYILAISVIAVLSQSRSFVLSATVFLGIAWLNRNMLTARSMFKKAFGNARSKKGVLLGLLLVGFALFFSSFVMELGQQTVDRINLRGDARINIDRRIAEWGEVARYFQNSDRSMIFGNASYPQEIRPHNVSLSAAILFGAPIAVVVFFLFAYLVMRYPLLIFIFVAAQTEILFVTGVYDFLVLAFLLVLTSPCGVGQGRYLVMASGLPMSRGLEQATSSGVGSGK